MDYIQNKITDGVDHYQSLNANFNRLKRKCEELNCRKKDVESQLKAELKPGKKLKEEVNFWLATVQRINEEEQSIIEENQSIANRAAPMRIVPGSRLGKLIVEKIQEVEEHHRKGSFSDGLVVDESPSSGLTLPTTTLAGETTTKKNMKEIWDCLMNDEIRSIGVYGLGGIGKTTIMKHIYNKLLKETDKFDNVFWVTVSKGVNVVKLQDAIASALKKGLSQRECETTRAAELFDMLRRKKRYVLILDDVWEAFELENVGIPEPTLDNRCKIVLTTRSLDVCRSMNCQSLKMELLSEEEAWNLFSDKVGRDVLSTPGLKPIMKHVAKECACLPLAVVTIGGSMKGVVDEPEWRNVLKELHESIGGLNDMGKVIEQLKYSYIRLKDEELQRCLLYCALFPEDTMIKRVTLIQYLIVEGIIKEGTSRRAEFDEGHSLLNKLENACLLESCTNRGDEKYVKMHDLIRDMALQIMGRRCMVKARMQLIDLPNEEQWTKDLEKVSLVGNYIRKIPSRMSPLCSRLTTLLLSKNEVLSIIPDSFFVHMHGLKVLDLSDNLSLKSLPNSISDLENLTALLLGGCGCLTRMPSLAKLRALRMLDLSWTRIRNVPQGMKMLVNLRWLSTQGTCLKMLPKGLLPELSRLQYLDVRSKTLGINASEVIDLRKLETFASQFYDVHELNTYVRSWQGRGPLEYILLVGRIRCRRRLLSRERIDDALVPLKGKRVTLRNCNISKGGVNPNPGSPVGWDGLGKLSRLIYFTGELEPLVHSESELHSSVSLGVPRHLKKKKKGKGGVDPLVLPKDIELLEIDSCHDVRSLCDISSLNDAYDCLKECGIVGCDGIQCVLSSYSCSRLQSLERLTLLHLKNLHILFRGQGASLPQPGTFSRLTVLYISNCPKIRKLFTPELLPYLQNLEQIKVYDCEAMEEIVAAKAEREDEMDESSSHTRIISGCNGIECVLSSSSSVNNDDSITTITLPKLKTLHLQCLPELKSIVCSRGTMVCDSLEIVRVFRCPTLKRLPLSLPKLNGQPSPPPVLQFIAVCNREWWESLEWDYPYTKDVLQPFLLVCDRPFP